MANVLRDLLLDVLVLVPTRDGVKETLSSEEYEANTIRVAKLLDIAAEGAPDGETRIGRVTRIAQMVGKRLEERAPDEVARKGAFMLFLAGAQEWLERKPVPRTEEEVPT
jgi:hypothetical protein